VPVRPRRTRRLLIKLLQLERHREPKAAQTARRQNLRPRQPKET